VRESVKPMEKIEGIRILHVDDWQAAMAATATAWTSATDEVIDSALRYRVQAPLIDSILADIGVEGGSLSNCRGSSRARDMQGIRKDATAKKESEASPAAAPAADAPPGEARPSRPGKRAEGARWPVYVSTVVNVRNDRVWARLRDFQRHAQLHPAIAESRIEGASPPTRSACVRDFTLRNGDRIREKLLGLSDYDMYCTYSIWNLRWVRNYGRDLR